MQPSPLSVLLIEDSPDDAQLIQELLTQESCGPVKVAWTDRLASGMERLARGGLDAVLLDLSLPDSQRIETFERVRAVAPTLPIIVLTGLDDDTIALEAVRQGAQDYLCKDQVDSKLLQRIIRYAIERKHIENELLRLASFPEQDPNPIIEIEISGAIRYLNPAAKAQFPELALQRPRHPIVERVLKEVEGLRREGRYSAMRELHAGHRIYEQAIFLPPVSDVIRIYMIDVTERRQVEEIKSELLSSISHELRTPLTAIREGVSQMLDGVLGEATGKQRQFLSVVLENIDRLGRLVNDVLDMSKLEAHEVELKREPVNLLILVNHLVEMVGAQAQRQGIAIGFSCAQPSVEMYVDRDRIAQVFTNLLNNALQFTVKGQIEVSLADHGTVVECRVSDTGPGIAEADLPKVFEKFQQFHQLDERIPMGTGLGLAISKALVELHGGTLSIRSTLGTGTTFVFTLPKQTAQEVFAAEVEARLQEAIGEDRPFAVVTFALVNAEALQADGGSEAVASLMSQVAAAVQRGLRRREDMAIVDGARVCIVLPGAAHAEALQVAERLTQLLGDHFSKAGVRGVEMACRVASAPEQAKTAEAFFKLIEQSAIV